MEVSLWSFEDDDGLHVSGNGTGVEKNASLHHVGSPGHWLPPDLNCLATSADPHRSKSHCPHTGGTGVASSSPWEKIKSELLFCQQPSFSRSTHVNIFMIVHWGHKLSLQPSQSMNFNTDAKTTTLTYLSDCIRAIVDKIFCTQCYPPAKISLCFEKSLKECGRSTLADM